MYQALVRIAKEDMTGTGAPASDAPSEGSRFDWAVLLDGLLRRMRDTRDHAGQGGGDAVREISRSGG